MERAYEAVVCAVIPVRCAAAACAVPSRGTNKAARASVTVTRTTANRRVSTARARAGAVTGVGDIDAQSFKRGRVVPGPRVVLSCSADP